MTPLRPHSEGGVRALSEASAEPIAPELRIRTLGTPQVWLGEVADAGVPPRAFDNRQPTPLRIVRREGSS